MTRLKLTWREYWYGTITWRWERVRDYVGRFIFAQHNARVIIDFEDRMAAVAYAASGGMMSKAYYTKEAMLAEIERAFSERYDEGYQDGREDLAEEHGIDLTRRCATCGCTDDNACIDATGTCSWVAIDRCSHCPADAAATGAA